MHTLVHLALHAGVPLLVARVFYPHIWLRAWLIMCATMLVDLDHLLAHPVFDPHRCSIGFHPLHRAPAIGVYALLTLIPALRLVGLGLLIHMAVDALDCVWMAYP